MAVLDTSVDAPLANKHDIVWEKLFSESLQLNAVTTEIKGVYVPNPVSPVVLTPSVNIQVLRSNLTVGACRIPLRGTREPDSPVPQRGTLMAAKNRSPIWMTTTVQGNTG